MSGRVVHFEIPYDDEDRARRFYAGAFDWQVQGIPGLGYTLVTTGPSGRTGPTEPGFVNGGLLGRSDSPSRTPVLVVDVDSIDTALATAESLGGRTLRGRQPVGEIGFAAYLEDPEGNVIGLWETAATS
jgi:predicted enzyme related to lactoylglutathione lyase